MSAIKREIYFVRRNRTQFGGAEKYLVRLSSELTQQGYGHRVIHSRLPKFLPSFLRAILFNIGVCLRKGSRFYFSLERISCPDIYRAGDGVHREFLRSKGVKIALGSTSKNTSLIYTRSPEKPHLISESRLAWVNFPTQSGHLPHDKGLV